MIIRNSIIFCHQICMKEDDLLHIYMNLCELDNILEENQRLVSQQLSAITTKLHAALVLTARRPPS